MRNFVSGLVALFAGLATFLTLAFLGLALGGADCDQGECNWLGEAMEDSNDLFMAGYGSLGALAAVAVFGAVRRRS